jgi:hypothetical protein
VLSHVASLLAGRGSEDDTLREVRRESPRADAEGFDGIGVGAAGVGTGEPDATPKVGLPRLVEGGDNRR